MVALSCFKQNFNLVDFPVILAQLLLRFLGTRHVYIYIYYIRVCIFTRLDE